MLWKALNHLNVKQNRQHTNLPPYDPNDVNNYFLSVFSQPNNCTNSIDKLKGKTFNENINFKLKLATLEEVSEIINSLKSNATGSDHINAKMLKLCCPIIIKYVTHS